jgi:putrescine importer
VAFTFVNLAVVAQFYIREKRNKTMKETVQYLILPLLGAMTVGVLWMNLEESSLVLGLTWALVGVVYMAVLTRRFRQPLPQMGN